MMKQSLFIGASLFQMAAISLGQAGEIARRLGLGNELSDSTISSGLKQALQIGAERQAHGAT
jgi:hypothetical protein